MIIMSEMEFHAHQKNQKEPERARWSCAGTRGRIFVFYEPLSTGQNLNGVSTAFRPQIGPVYRTMATTLMEQETFMNVDQYLGGGYIRA